MKATVDQKKYSVLLAEDNRINQKLVVLMLGKLGAEATVAGNGYQVVEMAQEKTFDLILMDIHMPGKNGLKATEEIKSALGKKSPPIVALTADTVQSSIEVAMKSGVDAYLTKPINIEMLKKCLEEHCN